MKVKISMIIAALAVLMVVTAGAQADNLYFRGDNNGGNTDWLVAGNWFTDGAGTIPAGRVPDSNDNVRLRSHTVGTTPVISTVVSDVQNVDLGRNSDAALSVTSGGSLNIIGTLTLGRGNSVDDLGTLIMTGGTLSSSSLDVSLNFGNGQAFLSGTASLVTIGDVNFFDNGDDESFISIADSASYTVGGDQTGLYVNNIDNSGFIRATDFASGGEILEVFDGNNTIFTSDINDTRAPAILILAPADGAVNVPVHTNFEIIFDENISVVSGNITIRNLTDSNDIIIPVTDVAQVSVTGALLTINPTANLDYLKDYAILIDAGAIEDASSNLFAGITDEVTWNFTTREPDFVTPQLYALNPADGANNVAVGADFAATFDENIVIGSGNITIENLTDGDTETVIPVTDSNQVYVYGNVLMINPANDLVASKTYAVLIDAGAIEDESANPFGGIATTFVWNFTAVEANVPNIIIIYSDDHGYTDLGLFGIDNNVDTPNMDSLAGGGALMTNGYSSAPQCRPSRIGLMAGRIQNEFGLDSNGADAGEGKGTMPRTYPAGSDMAGLELLTIADRMKALGYVTGFSGKWHCGDNNDSSQLHDPRSRGFDEYWVGPRNNFWANFDLAGNSIPHQQITDTRNRVIVQGQAAEAFIQRNRNNKFFLYFPIFGPHVPLIDSTDPYYTNFPAVDYPHYDAGDDDIRRKGLALIKAMDDAIGGVLQKLRDLGLEANTLILFCGDNGAPLGMRADGTPEPAPDGVWDGSENVPMRGQKGQLLEGGIHVPMFAYWKGTIPAGQVIGEMVTSLDFTATSVALGGGIIPPEFDGVNIAPRLTGQASSITRTRPMFWDWKTQQAVRKGDWKLWRIADRDFLYNISDDPHELFDLAVKEPAKAAELGADLDAWCTPLLDMVLPHGEVATAKNTLGSESRLGIYLAGNFVAGPDPRYFTPYLDAVTTPYPAPVTTMGMDFENFEILSEAWLSNDSPTINWNQYYDFDDSGAIDINDLNIFTDIWLMGN